MEGMLKKEEGFTLVELMVAVTIALVVMAAVYSSYRTQQKSYIVNEQIIAMQQNLRAAMFYMSREIRMAGCDPLGTGVPGIEENTSTMIHFTRDIRGDDSEDPDGEIDDTHEDITYELMDQDLDGDMDIVRNTGDGDYLLAKNIDQLDFVYLDAANNVTANISEIQSIQITIVGRTERLDPGYTDNKPYVNQQGDEILAAQNDAFHRESLTTNIRLRNL